MKNKKLLIAVVALVLVLAACAVVWFATRPETAQGEKTFTVTVVHSDGTSKVFTYTTTEEYLGAVLVAEGLVEGEDSEYGLYVKTVDGETADYDTDQSYWAVYEGEEFAMQGIDQTPVLDGSTFKLVYTADSAE